MGWLRQLKGLAAYSVFGSVGIMPRGDGHGKGQIPSTADLKIAVRSGSDQDLGSGRFAVGHPAVPAAAIWMSPGTFSVQVDRWRQ